MIGKISLLILAFFICEGYGATEIVLQERDLHYIRHPYLGTTISISKAFWDTLRSCHIIYPNRVMYEAYPENRLPHDNNIFFLTAVEPFVSCGIGFRDVGPEFSGTYELLSTVVHSSDYSVTLTRQRFNIRITEPDSD